MLRLERARVQRGGQNSKHGAGGVADLRAGLPLLPSTLSERFPYRVREERELVSLNPSQLNQHSQPVLFPSSVAHESRVEEASLDSCVSPPLPFTSATAQDAVMRLNEEAGGA